MLSEQALQVAMELWREQAWRAGLESGDLAQFDEWLANRTYPLDLLEAAAQGDIAAICEVRLEAGLPVLC